MTFALALLSGALLVVSFPKFGSPAFAWIALAPLLVAVAIASARPALRTFGLGILTGIVYFGGTLYWVVTVMETYGGLAPWLAVPIAGLLSAYLALYVGLFAWLVRFAVRRAGVAGVWLAPLFWMATEWLRATIGGGFPWVLLGTSQAAVLPVVQLASVAGVYGLSGLIVLVSTAAAAVTLSRRPVHRTGAVLVAGLLVVIAGLGEIRVVRSTLTSAGTPLRVGLVQGAVRQDDKYDPRFRDEITRRYLNLSRQAIGAGAKLVIWPEASTPFIFQVNSFLASPIQQLAVEARTPFLIGTDQVTPAAPGVPEKFYNAAILVAADGQSRGVYRKMHLVPFGEYVPLKDLLFFVKHLVESVSDYSPGTDPVVLDTGATRLSVSICYESVYPSLSRTFVARGSELLATITNDAWFGDSSAPYQHFQQGAVRAVEEGRYVVRAANTGISGAVDPYGRVLATTPLFTPLMVTADVRLLTSRTIYSRVGDVVVWVSLAATAAVVVLGWRLPRMAGLPAA